MYWFLRPHALAATPSSVAKGASVAFVIRALGGRSNESKEPSHYAPRGAGSLGNGAAVNRMAWHPAVMKYPLDAARNGFRGV
jgi:hypothetical protein